MATLDGTTYMCSNEEPLSRKALPLKYTYLSDRATNLFLILAFSHYALNVASSIHASLFSGHYKGELTL